MSSYRGLRRSASRRVRRVKMVVVDAVQNTVQQATGITARQTRYSSLDFESTELRTNRRETAVYQYDSKYAHPNNENKVGKAYRIYSESGLLSKKMGF